MSGRRTSTRFEDHQGFVHKIAKRYYGRAMRAKLGLDFDDILGELSLAFVVAAKGYDPSTGYVFTTFYGTCAQHHMNKVLGRLCREQYGEDLPGDEVIEGVRASQGGLGVISIHDLARDDDDAMDLLGADEAPSPADRLEALQTFNSVIEDNTLAHETRAYIALKMVPSLETDALRSRINASEKVIRKEIRKRWGVRMQEL